MALFQNLVIAVYFHYIFLFSKKRKLKLLFLARLNFQIPRNWIGLGWDVSVSEIMGKKTWVSFLMMA